MTGFADLIRAMTGAAVAGDGAGVAACFTEDGVYHDVFYGEFAGRESIRELIEERFHRDARNFIWDIHDPVEAGGVGYARYVFSYESLLKGHEGRRACFEGVGICRLSGGLIARYSEVADAGTGLSLIGFPPERIARWEAKQAERLLAREEARRHRP